MTFRQNIGVAGLLLLTAFSAAGEVVVRAAGDLVAVARGDRKTISVYRSADARSEGMPRLYEVSGPPHPRFMTVSRSGRGAVLDPQANQVVMFVEGRSRTFEVGETPLTALFLDETLFVVCRDSRTLERIDVDGGRRSIPTAADISAMAETSGRLFLYSRVEGTVQEFSPKSMTLLRQGRIAPFASDLILDSKRGYLALPQSGQVVIFSLTDLRKEETIAVGAVPVDLELEGGRNAVSAGRIAVANPSSKRIWRAEGGQSESEAFARGFVRGLTGLGLYKPRSQAFPTGVDRVRSSSRYTVAYDSSSRRLYQVAGKESRLIASNVGSEAFDISGSRVWFWDEDRKVLSSRTFP